MNQARTRIELQRLIVWRKNTRVYDQCFGEGINIIRGENGSGKSTIADFIFYAMGGYFSAWKAKASTCNSVSAQFLTPNGTISIRRRVDTTPQPMSFFYGPLAEALEAHADAWEEFPIKRSKGARSLSEVFFEYIGIPNSPSDGGANVTMHQALRLMYSDQRTPPWNLFRIERFDTQTIREAVGDLLCGISSYEALAIDLRLRDLEKERDTKSAELKSLFRAVEYFDGLGSADAIHSRIERLEDEQIKLQSLLDPTSSESDEELSPIGVRRREAQEALSKLSKSIAEVSKRISRNEIELSEIEAFKDHLRGLLDRLREAKNTAQSLGFIDFSVCPACLKPVEEKSDNATCSLCGSDGGKEAQDSKYLQVQIDILSQLEESDQLIYSLEERIKQDKNKRRSLSMKYTSQSVKYSAEFEEVVSSEDSERSSALVRLGEIGEALKALSKAISLANEIESVSAHKAEVELKISRLRDKREGLEASHARRRRSALQRISEIGSALLRADLDRQPEFRTAEKLEVDFSNDRMTVDGAQNFAESSNVILKNTSILSLLLCSLEDSEFFLPRFALFDNIEDKGMEIERSHAFQQRLVEESTAREEPFQLIFTTSMINPDLEVEAYTVGPHYTHDLRTLDF